MDKKKQNKESKVQAQQRPAATGSEEKGDELLLLTSNSRNIERCDKWSVWLSMQRGFNLNMRETNSPVTAGLRPVTVWIHSDLGQIKRPERYCRGERCLSGRVLWGTMTFLSRDDVTSLSQAFCATVCVCSSGQGQARGESNTTDQCCGHHWERHKHSQLTQPFLPEWLGWTEGGPPPSWVLLSKYLLNQTDCSRFKPMNSLCKTWALHSGSVSNKFRKCIK